MAISFIGRISSGQPNAGAVTLTLPGGMAVDDLILVMHCDGDTTDNAMPTPTTAGYTDVGASEQYADGSTNDSNSRGWYKYHNGTDTNCVLASPGGGTNSGTSGALIVFRGVATAAQGGPFSTAAVKATGTGNANPDNPSIATTTDDAVVLMVSVAMALAGTFTAPTNYTSNAELGTAGADTVDGKAAMAYRLSGYSNPEDPAAWACSGSGAGDAWTAITLALKVAPAAVAFLIHHLPDRSIYPGPTDA